jgi:hypothetical protein
MSLRVLALLSLTVFCTGCASLALEEYTLGQIRTLGELRDREVLHCLAQVAANPDTLPSFSSSADGITRISDNITLNATTTWTRALAGFASQTLTANANRAPQGTWTVDTVGDFERLEAMRCACLVALRGGLQRGVDCEILEDPRLHPDGKPHFGVAERLARLPSGWVGCGGLKDVPMKACHRAHYGKTWVWVMPEHEEAFAQFELAMLDIALLDYGTIYLPRLLVTLVRNDYTKLKDVSDPGKVQVITIQEVRAVKPGEVDKVQDALRKAMNSSGKAELSYAQWMEYTVPYHGPRTTAQPTLATVQSTGNTPVRLGPVVPSRPPERMNQSFRLE